MNLLLDTHALLWALGNPRRLPRAVARALVDPDNAVYASAVCTWEVAIKAALGKIDADSSEIAEGAIRTGFVELPIRILDTVRVRTLPPHHHDPFDRLLIAQAIEHGLTVVTGDPAFRNYDVGILWT